MLQFVVDTVQLVGNGLPLSERSYASLELHLGHAEHALYFDLRERTQILGLLVEQGPVGDFFGGRDGQLRVLVLIGVVQKRLRGKCSMEGERESCEHETTGVRLHNVSIS